MGAVLGFIGRGLVWFAGTTAGRALVSYFKDKIVSKLSAWWAKRKGSEEIDREAKESVQPLEKAKTKEERRAAVDNALDDF